MTKKDYIIIAAALSREITTIDLTTNTGQAMREQANDMVYSLSNALIKENPKFNRQRFLEACGVSMADSEKDNFPRVGGDDRQFKDWPVNGA